MKSIYQQRTSIKINFNHGKDCLRATEIRKGHNLTNHKKVFKETHHSSRWHVMVWYSIYYDVTSWLFNSSHYRLSPCYVMSWAGNSSRYNALSDNRLSCNVTSDEFLLKIYSPVSSTQEHKHYNKNVQQTL